MEIGCFWSKNDYFHKNWPKEGSCFDEWASFAIESTLKKPKFKCNGMNNKNSKLKLTSKQCRQ